MLRILYKDNKYKTLRDMTFDSDEEAFNFCKEQLQKDFKLEDKIYSVRYEMHQVYTAQDKCSWLTLLEFLD